MIPQTTIDEILSIAKIEEVVGEFVTLKKKGINFVGLCPFHDEKTPSFYVSPAKEIYKCFGCGQAGNSVRFIMDHEKYSYPEALRFLAKKYRIEIEENETEEDKTERDEIASIHIVLDFANNFYHQYLLNSEEGKNIGLKYLENRQIKKETIEKFSIGLSPSKYDELTKAALKNKYKEEYLIAAGLTIKTHDGRLIDRFRERVMFPIKSATGRMVGFGGRTLKQDPKEAKYINSPETKVYSKSHTLYGLDLCKQDIRKLDEIYIVEGYTDVIALHQAGIYNVVAALGTSLTIDHLKILKRYSQNISFIFDGDEAGIKASMRSIDIALKEELNVKAVSLPIGEDPDSFSKKNLANKVKLYIQDHKEDFIIFKTNQYLDPNKTDPIHRADVIKNIIKSISLIPSKLKRSIYIRELSRMLDIDESTLYSELNRELLSNKPISQSSRKIETTSPKHQDQNSENLTYSTGEQEKEIIKLLLLYGNLSFEGNKKVAEVIIDKIHETEWQDALLYEIFNEYINHFELKNQFPDIQYFINHSNLKFQDIASTLVVVKEDLSDNWNKKFGKNTNFEKNYEEQVISALNHFELRKYQFILSQNIKDLKKTDLSEEETILLQKAHMFLTKEINRISKEIKMVIY